MDVAARLEDLGQRSQGLVTTARLVGAGVPRWALAGAVRTGAVVRVHRQVYALHALPTRPRFVVTDAGVAPDYVAHVRAVLLSLGETAAASGRTAAALYGWGMLVEPGRTVEVAVPHGRGTVSVRGVRCCQRRGAARDRVQVLPAADRLRVTTPVQTVLDCAVSLPLLQAVVVCDSALRAGHVTVEELALAARSQRGVRAARRVRQVVELSDPTSGSVLESVLRVRLVLAGITQFVTQAVLSDKPLPLRVDFCFAAAGLVVEVDGARWHRDVARDQSRDNVLALLGWRVLRLSWAQVVHEPDDAVADIRTALAATPTLQFAAVTEDVAA